MAADNVAFPLPIRINMCLAEDGTEVSSQDQQTLRILGDAADVGGPTKNDRIDFR